MQTNKMRKGHMAGADPIRVRLKVGRWLSLALSGSHPGLPDALVTVGGWSDPLVHIRVSFPFLSEGSLLRMGPLTK